MKPLFEFLLKKIVDLKKTSILFHIVACGCCDLQGLPGQCVHGDFTHGNRTYHFHANWRNISGWRRLCGARTWSGPPAPIPIAWHPGIWGRGRSLMELLFCLKSQFFVFFNVNVYSQNSNCFCHNKRQSSKIKRPAIIVLVLFVLIPIITRITCIAWYVDNNSYNVTESCKEEEKNLIRGIALNKIIIILRHVK